MSDYKRIRYNLWHESCTRLRKVQDTPQCSCASSGSGGESCRTDLCMNRSCMIECDQTCPCGEECENQRIQKGDIPSVKVQKFPGSKGMGVIALQDIAAGDLIAEYVGEVINQTELARRMENQYRDMRHTYIMSYVKGLLLDATAKGGLARYLNHSCGPNCETQYWMVKGETRVGIFARQAIKAGTELCYDYNLQWNGFARVRCECGAASCVGWLGGRSAAQRAQERLHDSDDEAEACALYLDEDADGATKVQQLSTGPALPLPGHAAVDARRKARPGAMADPLPEAQVHAIVDSFLQAPCRYSSPYDALECAPGAAVPAAVREQWDGAREGAEQRWRGHEAAVKQLLLGMQGLGYATARVKRGAV